VNSIDRYQDDPASRITEAFQSMHALQVSLRNYTYHEVHILNRTSIESGKNATLTVKWDANISLVHQAKLTFKVQALRSNVSVAASGGGSTSSGGTSHTHSVSGTTSSGGSSHSHGINATTSDTPQSGTISANFLLGTMSGTPKTAGPDVSSTQDVSQGHTHTETGGTTSNQNQGHTHSLNSHAHEYRDSLGNLFTHGAFSMASWNHTHALSSTTSAAESTHTHSVSGQTAAAESSHTHTISAHTHALTYGIYESPSPSNPAINITINGTNRTAALGGAWNTVGSEVEVDITAYLQSGASEIPLQQSNTIVISGNVLADVEAVLRSRVTASSLVPV
jgi:hypothetical protein